VQESKIGSSPQKRGPKGDIPDHHYRNLCSAIESFVTIQNITFFPEERVKWNEYY